MEERQFNNVWLAVGYIKDTTKTNMDNNDNGIIFRSYLVDVWCLVLEG